MTLTPSSGPIIRLLPDIIGPSNGTAPRRSRAAALLLHHRAQLGFQHLAVVILRQRVEIDVALRPFEACDRSKAMGVEAGIVGGCALLKHDASDDDLAPIRIGHADRGDLTHAGICLLYTSDA